MATLGVMFGGSAFAMRGGSKPEAKTPPINAESKDEEKFIQFSLSPFTCDSHLTNLQGIHAASRTRRKEGQILDLFSRSIHKAKRWCGDYMLHSLYIQQNDMILTHCKPLGYGRNSSSSPPSVGFPILTTAYLFCKSMTIENRV